MVAISNLLYLCFDGPIDFGFYLVCMIWLLFLNLCGFRRFLTTVTLWYGSSFESAFDEKRDSVKALLLSASRSIFMLTDLDPLFFGLKVGESERVCAFYAPPG